MTELSSEVFTGLGISEREREIKEREQCSGVLKRNIKKKLAVGCEGKS